MTDAAVNYGQALYSLAKEETVEATVLRQLEVLESSFAQEPAFLRLLASPNMSKDQRCAVIDESFRGKVHEYLLNFLKLLVEKRRIGCFFDCCRVYRDQYNQDHGIVSVYAVTAVALTQTQHEKMRSKLEKITGKTVELKNKVDSACLGGVRLDYDGKRIDGTVKNRLDSVGELLKNTVL